MLNWLFDPNVIVVIGSGRGDLDTSQPIVQNLGRGSDVQICWIDARAAGAGVPGAVPHLRAAPEVVDLAIICSGPDELEDTLRGVALAGIPGALVMSALAPSGGPRGEQSNAIRATVQELAANIGTRFIGCASAGLALPQLTSRDAAPARAESPVAGLALITDAGEEGFQLARELQRRGAGPAWVFDLGDALDLGAAELLEALAQREDVDTIALHLQRIPRSTALVAALTRVAAKVSVVVCGSEARVEERAALRAHAPLIVSQDLRTFLDLTTMSALGAIPTGPKLALLSDSESALESAGRSIARVGLSLAEPSETTCGRIRSEVGHEASVSEGVHLGLAPSPRHWGVALEALRRDSAVDGVLVLLAGAAQAAGTASALASAAAGEGAPVHLWTPAPWDEASDRALLAASVVRYDWPEAALCALGLAVSGPAPPQAPDAESSERGGGVGSEGAALVQALLVAALLRGRRELGPGESARILQAYGLSCAAEIPVASPHAARRAAAELGYPVSLRVTPRQPGRIARARVITMNVSDGDALEAELLRVHAQLSEVDPDLAYAVLGATGESELITIEIAGGGHFGPSLRLWSGDDAPPSPQLALVPVPWTRALQLVQNAAHAEATSPSGASVARAIESASRLAADFPELVLVHLRLAPSPGRGGDAVVVDARLQLGDPSNLLGSI